MHSQSAVIKLATPCGDVSPRPHIIFFAADPKAAFFSSLHPLSLSLFLSRFLSRFSRATDPTDKSLPCATPASNPFVASL